MKRDDEKEPVGKTAAQWYVELDAGGFDARTDAELGEWLASNPEHEAELARCDAAVVFAGKLTDRAAVRRAFGEAARVASVSPRAARPAWYARAGLAWAVAAACLAVAILAVVDRVRARLPEAPGAPPASAEASYAAGIDLAAFQPIAILPGEVVVDARSVAVLPFAGEIGPSGNARAAREIAAAFYDDVLRELAAIPGVYVVGGDAVFPYTERDIAPVEIATQLGVRGIVEAVVGYEDGRIRVSLSLIDAARAAVTVHEAYERPLEEVEALQADVVAGVVDALGGIVTAAESVAAYQYQY